MGTIALLTDFGESDGFVGMLKGVILKTATDCRIVDLTHSVRSFDIQSAAFILQKSVQYFPEGTVFIVVVDPGVGSERKIIAAQAGGYSFVAPDNGVLSFVLAEFPERRLVSVENEEFFSKTDTYTFDGRDKMAPVAAYISMGTPLEQFGPRLDKYNCLKMPSLLKHPGSVIGETVYVDKFGNMISNISRSDLPDDVDLAKLTCRVGEQRGITFVDSYAAGHGLSAIISGFGTVEIFINQGKAAGKFVEPIGTVVTVEEQL